MLEKCKTAKERWGGVHHLVDHWLHERQELIMLLFAINGLDDYTPKNTPVSIKIQAFCQVMMDYLSAAHFEIYEQLMREADDFNDESAKAVANQLYPKIEKTTDLAVTFNDDYDTAEHCETLLGKLPERLSELAEALELRFELEDQLIQSLHTAHQSLIREG